MKSEGQIQVASCPECGAMEQVIPVKYGKPGPELQLKAKKGEVHLGGCCPQNLKWYCKNCEKKF